MAQSVPERVTALLGPVVSGAGLVLEAVTITPAGKRRVVRVVVDLPDDESGSLDLDQVADVSRAVSEALDASDVLGGQAYVLEVSSPGVDRPLTERRHWSRARGRLVQAQVGGGEAVTGRVLSVDDAGVVLATDTGERTLGWDVLGRGAVQVEFRHHDEGGGQEPGSVEQGRDPDDADAHDDDTDADDDTDEGR